MKTIAEIVDYLKLHQLRLATAESCTAGLAIALLADIEGFGAQMDCGYVVYSPQSKQRLLSVRAESIETFGLTSEVVAREMAEGALRDSTANVTIANTGVAGPEPMDGIAPGTVCMAWGFVYAGRRWLYSETKHFSGDRQTVRHRAAEHSILEIYSHHQALLGMGRV